MDDILEGICKLVSRLLCQGLVKDQTGCWMPVITKSQFLCYDYALGYTSDICQMGMKAFACTNLDRSTTLLSAPSRTVMLNCGSFGVC